LEAIATGDRDCTHTVPSAGRQAFVNDVWPADLMGLATATLEWQAFVNDVWPADLMGLATATLEWQAFVNDVWPADRLRKTQPGGKKLATLVDCASEAMQALLKAVERQPLPDQEPPSAQP
jgi:hypothetical protein